MNLYSRPIFQQLIGNEAEPVGDILPLFKSEGQKISDEELVKLIGELKK